MEECGGQGHESHTESISRTQISDQVKLKVSGFWERLFPSCKSLRAFQNNFIFNINFFIIFFIFIIIFLFIFI